MQENSKLLTQLEQALFAIKLSISTLKGDNDPRQLHLFGPPPQIEITEHRGHLCILVKRCD